MMMTLYHDSCQFDLDHECPYPTTGPPNPVAVTSEADVPKTDPPTRSPVLVSSALLHQVWSSIGSPTALHNLPINFTAVDGDNLLENAVTHIRIATCTPNLSKMFHVFPCTRIAELHDLYIHRSQTHVLHAPSLRGLVIWGCTVEGDALGSLLAGSPELVYLAVGGYGFDVFAWDVHVAGNSMPAPRFGPNLRWALLDISSQEMAYHVQSWAHRTPTSVPIATLRLRLSVRTISTMWALWTLSKTTISDLYLLIIDREYVWSRDVFEVMNLELQSLDKLHQIYIVVHDAYLTDVVLNIRDLTSPFLEFITLAVVISNDDASLHALLQLDGLYRVGKFPALRKAHIKLVPSVDFSSERYTGPPAQAIRDGYMSTTREHCSTLDVRHKLEVSIATFVQETAEFLEPLTPSCSKGPGV